jgi:hypothetical protein
MNALAPGRESSKARIKHEGYNRTRVQGARIKRNTRHLHGDELICKSAHAYINHVNIRLWESVGSKQFWFSFTYTAGRVRRHIYDSGALMWPRKSKPSPQGSYGQRSPGRVIKSSLRRYAPRPCTVTLRHGDGERLLFDPLGLLMVCPGRASTVADCVAIRSDCSHSAQRNLPLLRIVFQPARIAHCAR